LKIVVVVVAPIFSSGLSSKILGHSCDKILFYISALFLFADVFVSLQYPVCDIVTVDFFAWWTVWFHVRDPGTTLVLTHSTRRMFLMYGGRDKVKKQIKKKVKKNKREQPL